MESDQREAYEIVSNTSKALTMREWLKRRWEADYSVKHWFIQLFICIDQLANILVTPLSKSAWADETLSCRAYRAWRDKKALGFLMHPIDLLFFWQDTPEGVRGHCHNAYLNEAARYNSPPEIRG